MMVVTCAVAAIIVPIPAMINSLPESHFLARESFWLLSHLVHVPQFLIPFAIILVISKGRPQEYGFNLRQDPPTFTHIRMFALGTLAGLLLSLRYVSSVITRAPLDIPQPVTTASVLESLTFQWIVVGLSEETMFRGLIQTYLMKNLEGYVRLVGHDLHIGTVVAAILWGLFHLINVLVMTLEAAVFTAVVTTIAGLLMGYAYQRTRSLLTTIIVHNTMFGVPLAIGYILYGIL
jgi:membrane protease YdiL (CAAX protease family)